MVGCGDAFGSGGQFQTCLLLNDDHGTMAIDFGASSLVALRAGGHDPFGIGLVLLSHFHGDHMGGLPFLLLDREFNATDPAPLCIAGPPGLPERLRSLMECMFPGSWRDTWRFPVTLVEITPGTPVSLGHRRILSARVQHPTGPFAATALRIETCGKVIAFSGDTGWVEALIGISADCDLFICECFEHTVQPYDGHLSLPVLLDNLPRITARRVVITHLGPEMVAHRATLPLDCLTDGATLTV